MAGKSRFNPEECIANVNNVKKAIMTKGNSFTYQRLVKAFFNTGLPKSSTFWQVFRKHHIVEKDENNLFRFCNENPINVEQVKQIYKEYSCIVRNNNAKAAKKRIEESERIEESSKNITDFTEEAIKHLKSLGYKIYKPQTKYVEL